MTMDRDSPFIARAATCPGPLHILLGTRTPTQACTHMHTLTLTYTYSHVFTEGHCVPHTCIITQPVPTSEFSAWVAPASLSPPGSPENSNPSGNSPNKQASKPALGLPPVLAASAMTSTED